MVEEAQKKINIFISYSNADEIQYNIFDKICEKYSTDNNNISIVDVDNDYSGVNDKLCEGILHKIKKSDMFICMLTPINDNNSIVNLNNNVILELGCAYDCISSENIYIFIENDEIKKKDFERLRPRMMSSIKYKTYNSTEGELDIIDVIEHKKTEVENKYKYKYDFNQHILLDKNVISLIKYDMLKLLNSNKNIKDKLTGLDEYIKQYKHIDIVDLVFLFINQYIVDNQMSSYVLNYFFHFASNNLLDDFWHKWMYQKNNQITTLNLLRIIKYQLFEKFKNNNSYKAHVNRRNFAIIVIELIYTNFFAYKQELTSLLYDSINNYKSILYNTYVCNLKKLNEAIKTNDIKNKHHYEDLILKAKKCYNKYWI